MAKQQRRKPPKRAPGRPQIDDDLAELASVLDELKHDNDTAGWFEIPWRSGWNAARFAYASYSRFRHDDNELVDPEIASRLAVWIHHELASPKIYEAADSAIAEVAMRVLHHNLTAARFLIASLRCVQLTIANSSGGGVTYNDVLGGLFERLPSHWPVMVQAEMRDARCHDSIGVYSLLANDKNDRLRRAFLIAWDRGLYQAAYALPRAT